VLKTNLGLREFYRELAGLYLRLYSPLRILNHPPATLPPIRPGIIVKSMVSSIVNYRRIRNGYRQHPGKKKP